MLTHQIAMRRTSQSGPYRDLEANFFNAVKSNNEAGILELVRQADILRQQAEGRALVTRILWKTIIDAPAPIADFILSSLTEPFDFHFVDDINGRTCLHEAAISGELRLLDLCISKGVQLDRVDVYGMESDWCFATTLTCRNFRQERSSLRYHQRSPCDLSSLVVLGSTTVRAGHGQLYTLAVCGTQKQH